MKQSDIQIVFPELEDSEIIYLKEVFDGYIEYNASSNLNIECSIYDEVNEQFIIAIWIRGDVDYLFLDKNYNIIKAKRETEGVNPKFIVAPDKSIWVSLTYTGTDQVKEIVLPLENRARINKLILKRDIGYDYYFSLKNKYYSYCKELFNDKDRDMISYYEFNKKGIYKGKKTKKIDLPNRWEPIVCDDELYIVNYIDTERKILVRKLIEENFEFESKGFDFPQGYRLYPLECDFENNSSFMYFEYKGNVLNYIEFDSDGKVVDNHEILKLEQIDYFFSTYMPVVDKYGIYTFKYNSGQGNGAVRFNKDKCISTYFEDGKNLIKDGKKICEINGKISYEILEGKGNVDLIAYRVGRGGKDKKKFIILK
ncbi:hypothetical protein [Intestinibacter sp.]|uniref:hypothetical protein n=1 Tax=Intestinibacter sp. TaxID=1965304 RepID=UPI003F169CD9